MKEVMSKGLRHNSFKNEITLQLEIPFYFACLSTPLRTNLHQSDLDMQFSNFDYSAINDGIRTSKVPLGSTKALF